jgi:circadian clock protein KaiB
MTPARRGSIRGGLEQLTTAPKSDSYTLTLFVNGASDASARAIGEVREMCDQDLGGRHDLSIVDLSQEPALAARHHVLATPTLVKVHPLPVRLRVGDMSDHALVLLALGVPAAVDAAGVVEQRAGP